MKLEDFNKDLDKRSESEKIRHRHIKSGHNKNVKQFLHDEGMKVIEQWRDELIAKFPKIAKGRIPLGKGQPGSLIPDIITPRSLVKDVISDSNLKRVAKWWGRTGINSNGIDNMKTRIFYRDVIEKESAEILLKLLPQIDVEKIKAVYKDPSKLEEGKPTSGDRNIALDLPRGEMKVLKAEEEDYDRGLLVKLLDDGGYEMAYWYEKHVPFEVEVLVDGKSIKKDARIVEMKFHPELIPGQEDKVNKFRLYDIEADIKDLKDKIEKVKAKKKKVQETIEFEQDLDSFVTALGEDLRAWFGKGKDGGAGGGGWDAYDGSGKRIGKCGSTKGKAKPKCLSKSKAASLRRKGGKKAIGAAVKKKRRQDPNKNRRGKAKNVSNTKGK